MRVRHRMTLGILLAVLLLGAGGDAGEGELVVHVLRTHLMPRASRFGRPVQVLMTGAKVTVLDESKLGGGWVKVRTTRGSVGWLPLVALTHGKRLLRSGSAERADRVERGNVQLAARGFTEDIEKKRRAAHPELDYDLVDAIEASQPGPGMITEQARAGGLRLGDE